VLTGWRCPQVLVLQGAKQLTHFGRHQRKLDLVSGSGTQIVKDDTATTHAAVRAWLCRASCMRAAAIATFSCVSNTDSENAGLTAAVSSQGQAIGLLKVFRNLASPLRGE